MAQWNLSVDLRSQGNSLGRTLREDAGHARTLATAVRSARSEVRSLGQTSQATARQLNGMGQRADAARARLGRLAAQAGRASRDLRNLASEAQRAERRLNSLNNNVNIRIDLDDRTGTSLATLRATLAELRANGSIRLDVDFDQTSIAAAAVALRALRADARDTARTLTMLRARASALADALDDLRDRAIAAAGGIRRLGTAAQAADGRLSTLSGSARTLRGDLDDLDGSLTRVAGNMGGLRGSLGSTSSSAGSTSGNMRKLILAAVALSTALIPIAAATVPVAAGLTAAGVGAGMFGVAIAGQIKSLTEAVEAETKYQEAVEEHGAHSKEASEAQLAYSRQMAKMPPATREAAAAVDVLRDQYNEWSDSLADDTMPVATKSMALLGGMFKQATPFVKGTSREMDRFVTILAGGMQAEGFREFMDDFAEFSTESLAKANIGLVKLTQGMDSGEIGANVREFMAYARENGPLVGDTLSNLATTLLHLLVAASDMGVGVLQLVNVLSQLVNAVPTDVLSTFLQLYAVMKLVTMGAAGLAAVTGSAAAGRLAAYFAVMRAAGVGTTLRATAASMSLMTKASIGLGVVAVAAVAINELAENARGAPPDIDKLTASIKNLNTQGKFTGELKSTFGDMDGFVEKAKAMRAETDALDRAKPFTSLIGMGPVAEKLASKIDDLARGSDSLTAKKEDYEAFDKSFADLATSGHADLAASEFKKFDAVLRASGHSTAEIAALFPEYSTALAALKAEQEYAAQAMGVFGAQAQATSAKLAAQKASADGLRQAIQALNDVNRAALGGMIGFEASIDAAAKAAKDNAGSLNMVNGQLDLNSPKAQAAATALADLGAKTDEAAASARAGNASWEQVNGIYERGRSELVKYAQQMGLTEPEARALAASILDIPDEKTTRIEMRTEDAVAGLDSVIAAIEKTPNAKSVTVKALTDDAVSMLRTLGFKVEQLKDGQFRVIAETGTAQGQLGKVKSARDGLTDKTIQINGETQDAIADLEAVQKKVGSTQGKTITMRAPTAEARKQLEALGFTIKNTKGKNVTITAPTGKQRAGVDGLRTAIAMLRNRSVTVTYTTVYRIKGKPGGPPGGTYYGSTAGRSADGNLYGPAKTRSYADGGMERHVAQIAQPTFRMWAEPETGGESYIPLAPSKRPRSRAIAEETVRRLGGDPAEIQWYADGGGIDYTHSAPSLYQLSSIAGDSKNKKGTFDPVLFAKKLGSSTRVARAWRKDLATVAGRAGQDVADALEAMGTEGIELTRKMATGSSKYTRQMAASLRALAETSKATLGDYTGQLNKTITDQTAFQNNLVKLAASGNTDLAKALAAQGDQAAADLAAAAVRDPKRARQANTASRNAANALSPDQVQQLVAIIAAVKTSKTGLHDVADTTGLGEDDIIATATRATGQIKSSLGSRATKFLADLARAQKGLSYANGGIRPGIYSTQAGAVTFAEPETGGEAYIPLGQGKRRVASTVLHDVARRFGVGLTDISSSRQVVVIKDGDTNVTVTAVRTGASASDIGSQVSRGVRRARRGGVNARA